MARRKKRDAEDLTDGAVVAKSLQSKRTKTSTKRTYQSKVSIMTAWLATHFPETIDTNTNKMQIPLSNDAVLAFFGHICSPAHLCDRDNLDSKSATSIPLSASCIWGYRSALVDVYRSKLLELDPQLDTELRRVLEGYEKVINDLKKRGLLKINEGKRQLKASGYELLALKLMTIEPTKNGQTWSTVLFGWCFFLLMWNLMSRADSVDTIMLQHIEWSDDCLIVEEQGHKGDQTGAEKFGKHVYANPYEPSQCPILALAVHLFSCPERSVSGKQQLFLGSDSKDRFGRILRRAISTLSDEEMHSLSCTREDIGTHSLRKGSSSYALGQVNGPTPVSVYLRMGQSLGKLKDRYIHFGEGADQLCGRMITGLPFNSERFGVLPTHFPPQLLETMTTTYWNEIVSGYSSYPRGVQSAFPFLLAALIHHEQYLRDTLSSKHPIFTARVFTANSLLDVQRGATVLAIGVSPVCGLKATGIPAHLAVAKQVNDLRVELVGLRNEFTNLKTDVASNLPSQVAATVVSELRQYFVINGVAPISLRDLDTRIDDLRTSVMTEFHDILSQVRSSNSDAVAYQTEDRRESWGSWQWQDGQICHAVPKGWEFPVRTSVKTMWNLWFFGNKDTGIRPYEQLSKQHDIQSIHQMRHSRTSVVMTYVEQLAQNCNVLPAGVTRISALPITTADKVFDVTLTKMLKRVYKTKPK